MLIFDLIFIVRLPPFADALMISALSHKTEPSTNSTPSGSLSVIVISFPV